MKSHSFVDRTARYCAILALVGLAVAPASANAWQETDSPAADAKSSNAPAESKPKRPPIYGESADAQQQIASALAKAKSENRRVLIQWGANWCGWCHLLHDTMKSHPEIARKIMYEYDIVLVDIGRMDKNMELVAEYEADLKGQGVPFITILDATGNVLVNQETSSLEKEDKENPAHNPEAVLAFLTQYQAEPIDGRARLSDATKQAAAEDKLVFLHFGAPWCGWCHRLEAWMAKPEIHDLVSSAFVDVKIDTDRMTGGAEILAEYCEKPGGIPWFVFIDPQTNEVLATSDGPKGNVGFPFEDFEIEHFCDMLARCPGKFSPEQIATLKQSLVENRDAIKAQTAQRAAQVAAEAADSEKDH